MDVDLTKEEVRVIGCLMEKSVTTPDQYPLTLNALTNACNQKSSREPVMQLEQGVVQRTTRQLEDKYLLTVKEGFKAGVEKYSQRLCNTQMATLKFPPPEFAVVTLLMLRGAQTPGELRSRAGRLYAFADNQEVVDTLTRLMEREGGPVVARLPRKPGRQDHEYMHLFAGEIESVAAEESSAVSQPRGQSRIDQLEARIDVLERALLSLADKLGEDVTLENPIPSE